MSTPVSNQPQKMEMMAPNQALTGLPASLQYLAGLDQIIIKQKIEALEVLTGFETRNRYAVMNNQGQQIFFVQEESSLCERCFFPGIRGFQLHVTDNNTQEMMRFSRDFKCCTGCCWCGEGCCSMTINVETPVGRLIGKIKTGNSKWKAHMKIYDAADNHMFTIWGPCCPWQAVCCPDDVNFPITDPTLQHRVGNIAKQWRGCCVDTFTDADQFCLSLNFEADNASAAVKPKSEIMYVWQVVNLIMAVFFVLAGCVNLNDGDWFLWVPIYFLPAFLSGCVVIKPTLAESRSWNSVVTVHFTLCCAYALYQIVLLIEAVGNRLENPLQHEAGREMGGLLIIITWLGISRFTSIGRPNASVSSKGMMSALLLMTVTLTLLPLFLWSLCFISDWHTRIGHCSGMFS